MRKAFTSILTGFVIVGLLCCIILVGGIVYLLHKVDGVGNLLPIAGSHTVSNVTYCNPAGTPLSLDLYIPNKPHTSFPVVLFVHGGSWTSGSKDEGATTDYLPTLAQTGYVVASVNYRLAPAYTFPAAVDDVKCAVRFLRANAGRYQIDPAHVGIIGESAGGYLAAFAGVTGNSQAFKTAAYSQESDSVQAVIDISGPTDFTSSPGSASSKSVSVARTFLGSADPTLASVGTYVTKNAAPFYIIHGQNDTTVPPSQAQELATKLTASGVPVQLVLVPNVGHSIDATSAKTAYAQLVVNMLAFLNQHLK